VRAGSLEELTANERLIAHGRIDRYSSFTTEIVSWRSTIVALMAFRWIAAASMAHPDLKKVL
jgi:hypothetical protein